MATGTLINVQGSDTINALTAKDTSGAAVDVSAATEIKFAVFSVVSYTATALLTKKLSTGAITLPNGGSDGRMDVQMEGSESASLTPINYEYQLEVTIGANNRVSRKGIYTLEPGANFGSI